VAEQLARLVFAFALVGSAGVTGVFLGTPLALAAVAVAMLVPLRRLLPHGTAAEHPIGHLFVRAGAPVAALALVAWMQDGNVIIVKHVATAKQAGLYASAAVAAKAVMWIAVGLGLFLVPEAARRARLRRNAAGVLASTLGLVGLVAVPMVLIYAVAGTPLMKAAFGAKFAAGAEPLPWLGVALSLLACTYLAVQYHLALHRWRFIGLLALTAIVQPAVVIAVGPDLVSIAVALAAVNTTLAAIMVALAFRVATHPEDVEVEPEGAGDAIAPSETLA
jgi:O-antigen/teichoic acid export membrane protein